MYLTRRFAPALGAICLLIVLFALAIVSLGDGFGKVSSQGEWLRNTDTRLKRDGALMSFPWSRQRLAGDARDDLEDKVLTITVCANIDFLPKPTANPSNTFPAVVQISAGPYDSGLANISSISTAYSSVISSGGVLSNATSSNTALKYTASSNAGFISTTSIRNNTSSAVPSNDAYPISSGLICQYNPPTICAADCSRYVSTRTVSSCNATKISFIAAFTVTVTANFSTSVTPSLAKVSSIEISSKSIQEISSLPTPSETLSSSVAVCQNGTLAGSSQDCALSSNALSSVPSTQNPQAATIPGLLSTFLGPATVPQTLPSSVSNFGYSNGSNIASQEDNPTASSPISDIVTGTAVKSNTVSDGGHSSPAISLGSKSSVTSLSTTALASASSIESPAPSRINSLNNTSSISLSGNIPVESLVSSHSSDPQLPNSLPASVGTKGPQSGFVTSISSGLSSVILGIGASPELSSTASGNINSARSSKSSSISLTQGVFPGIGSGNTAVQNSALPSITGSQIIASGVATVEASVIPEISSAQVLISSAVSDVTAAAASVLPIVTSISAVLNGILSEVDSFSSAVLSPIIASQGLKLSTGNNPTAAVLSPTTFIGAAQPSVLSSINPVASFGLSSIQSPVSSIENDAPTARPTLTFSVPTTLQSALSNISPGATSALSSGQGLISDIGSNPTDAAINHTTPFSAAPDELRSTGSSSLTLGLDPLQSLAPSIASDATTIPETLLTSATAVVNIGLSNGRPAVDSSVSDTLNSVVSNVNSISISVPASLHSSPDEVNDNGNILASIVRPVDSVIPPVVNAVPDMFRTAVGGGLVRDDVIPVIVTVTRVVNVVTDYVPSAIPISAL